ncbi:hypothetical protein CK203_019611 [Vitis vinifera]|uniref:Reverse transcriptase Ty1/copia-type domain-containing protein n=1 Tax=Vitis vinifera TaxID=29760 RepID=A0A438JQM6_VITVI|nr:hypothetical protein CK203_019611 [Vitis vinifera]
MSAFGTLELMSLPRGKSTVDYKWVFIVKNNSFSIIERCKLNVKNALLNKESDEEVYMDLPPTFKEMRSSNKVARSKQGISVSRMKYKGDLLKGTGILRCEPIETFMKLNYKFKWNKGGTPIDKGKYQRLVGKLINLTHTRPDLASL